MAGLITRLKLGTSLAALISLGVVSGGGSSGPWNDPNALEIDWINGRYAKNGTVYADQASLLTALAGGDALATASVTSLRWTVGNFVSAGITEELLDGTFDTGTGWTPGQSSGGPATLEIAPPTSGHIVGNGAVNPRIDQKINPIKGKAYRLTGTVGRGTSGFGTQLGVGMTAGFGTPISQSALTPSTNTYTINFSSAGSADAPDVYIGVKTTGTVTGTNYATADGFTCKECWPFDGFQQGFVSGRIRFRSMATGTGTFYLLSFDDNALNGSTAVERNYIRIAEVNGVMQLIINREVTAGATSNLLTMSLGAVSPSTDHYIDFGVAPGFVAASMDGGAPQNSLITNIPGISHMRLHYGRATGANLWDNANTWLTLYNTLVYPAGANPASFVNFGDSYGRVGGYIKNATGLIMRDKSAGGIDLQEIYNRVLASSTLYGLPTVLWDGKPNGSPSATQDYLDMIEAIGNLVGWDNIVISGPVKTIIGSGENAGIDARRAGIQALCSAHGGYYVDAQAILAAHGNGSAGDNAAIAAGVCPPSLLEPDEVHVNAAGNAWVVGDAVTAGTFAKALKDMGAW
ncbi:hypothetical protein HJB67_13180 [Rhizobium lentis]|uniref:hypothetical protein n=1 Tax=Rhizobium lentis TaxID=1138194 RepID=UPI001C831CC6|nr:hypothetical protein [Rhizobium lentis]MBX5010908.1 hypothetical protein [Rhizobium lentis]